MSAAFNAGIESKSDSAVVRRMQDPSEGFWLPLDRLGISSIR